MTDHTKKLYEMQIELYREKGDEALRQLADDLRNLAADIERHADRMAECATDRDAANQIEWALNAYRNTRHSSERAAETSHKELLIHGAMLQALKRAEEGE